MNLGVVSRAKTPVSQKSKTVLFFVLVLQLACEHTSTGPVGQLSFLGFEDKFALRLAIEEPYLYVCAGSDGVWRKNIRQPRVDWEYLGLRDTTLGKYTNVGALDMDVLDGEILVAYNGSAIHIKPESTVAIWRRTKEGNYWLRSDSGIVETIPDPRNEYNIITSLARSPHREKVVLARIGPAIYRSENSGYKWELISGQRGVLANMDVVRWNPSRLGEAWFFGVSSVFSPYLFHSIDYGETFGGNVNFSALGFRSDGAVYDVAFDTGNSNTVYAATSYGVIKSNDGGVLWQTTAINLPDKGFVFRMASHPSLASALYFAGGQRVYTTSDGGVNVRLIGKIERGFITSLAVDIQHNELYVGTTQGGIFALNLEVDE